MYTHYIKHMHLLRDSLISYGHSGGRSYASTPLAVSFAACTAVILLLTRDASFRTLLVKGSAAVMMGLALAVAVTCFDEPVKIGVDSELLKAVMLAADFLVILTVCYYAKNSNATA